LNLEYHAYAASAFRLGVRSLPSCLSIQTWGRRCAAGEERQVVVSAWGCLGRHLGMSMQKRSLNLLSCDVVGDDQIW
jgi:hypothetical protein